METLKFIKSEDVTEENLNSLIPRTGTQLDSIRESVNEIIQKVKDGGDRALIELTKEFDGVALELSEIQVSKDEISEAYDKIDKDLLKAIRTAKQNLLKFQEAQKREDWSIEINKGVKTGQIYRPLESVGLYIPGGRAIYPSTVLMAAAPACVAGVKNIIICSPPQKDKNIAPEILVAASEFEIDTIFKVGGAQAIAAMAFGTKTIPKVQKAIGPGNKWVNAAKQLLSNVIAIDTPAGPSEVLIIADDSANYEYVILDFISQIEHDPENIGIIVSDSSELLEKVKDNMESFVQKSERKDIILKALKNNSLLIKANDMDDCIRVSNVVAPEHLELMTRNSKDILKKITNAGAIFIGPYSPVPLGDYSAGTNHILPTGGNADRYSGLILFDFLKVMDVLECTREGLENISESSMKLAEFEGLQAHKKSIEKRLEDKN